VAESVIVRNKRDGTILLADSGAAHTYTVAYEPGDFSYTVPGVGVELYLDRGVMADPPSIRDGDDAPMTLAFSAYMRDVGSATYATLLDIAHRYAAGYVLTNWVSTMGSGTGPTFTITVTLTINGAAFGESDKSVAFKYVAFRANAKEGSPNTVDCSGTSYANKPVFS
jgi:hypothetical protein